MICGIEAMCSGISAYKAFTLKSKVISYLRRKIQLKSRESLPRKDKDIRSAGGILSTDENRSFFVRPESADEASRWP